MSDFNTSNMIGYFYTFCALIDRLTTDDNRYIILPAGEMAIAEYESGLEQAALSEKSCKASLNAAKASAFAALFAGLSFAATIVFGILDALGK